MFDRIVIGTANWGKNYNGSRLFKSEIKDILDYCACNGISMIDTAEDYESEQIIGELITSNFDIVTKGRGNIGDSLKRLNRDTIYGYLWREPLLFGPDSRMLHADKTGMSIYEAPGEGHKWGMRPGIIQVPYSIMDRRLENLIKYWSMTGVEVHVRSIYLRGKCLEVANPQECLAFVLSNRFVDKVVIGVDSLQQLKDNVEFIHKWNSYRCDNEEILDPRKWETKE